MLKQRFVLILFTCLTVVGLVACGMSGTSGSASNGTPGSAKGSTPTVLASPTHAAITPSSSSPFRVTSIDMAVNPASIAGMACGQSITVTYTATFHAAANSPGGAVQFMYTVNNGRSTRQASLNFGPGETTKAFSFTWQGALSSDNVYPGLGGVLTSSPNEVRSPEVKPAGTCVSSAAFQVTSIDLSVSPSSIAGMSCNSNVTLTYTVMFHVAANSPGGKIQFMYTTNNGRASTNGSVTADAGQTTVVYTFTNTGVLYPDHTFPGIAEVITSSPNQVNSPQVKPTGQCS